jgi:hypothetical protein
VLLATGAAPIADGLVTIAPDSAAVVGPPLP